MPDGGEDPGGADAVDDADEPWRVVDFDFDPWDWQNVSQVQSGRSSNPHISPPDE